MTFAAVQPTDPVALTAVLAAARQPIDVICDRWTLALVEGLLLRPGGYTDLQLRTGLASRLLAARLRVLRESGILIASSAEVGEGRAPYRLTPKGEALRSVLDQMARWERRWPESPASPVGDERLRCRACGQPASAREIDLRLSLPLLQCLPPKQRARRRTRSEAAPIRGGVLGPSLDIFGDKWGIEVLLCAFFRVRRFNAIRRTTGMAANILADRLARLAAAGVLQRSESDGYRLTEPGVDLYGVIVAIQDWADRWLEARYRSPVALVHRGCGELFHPAEPALG